MKTAIVYYSTHHGNTKKLLDALPTDGLTLIDASKPADLSAYDRVGFASGVYAGSFGKPLLDFAKAQLPAGKPVFFVATAAMKLNSHFAAISRICAEKNCRVLGQFICQGYNTYGPFKLIGGTSKGHPSEEDIRDFVAFYQKL